MRKKVFRRKSRFRFRIKTGNLFVSVLLQRQLYFSLVLLPLFIVAFSTEDAGIIGKTGGVIPLLYIATRKVGL